jgi:WD40 repeat protein/Ca2+-binding EF-hand superfamily protein
MGLEISKIAFSTEFVDLKVVGFSKVQVDLISQYFISYASRTTEGDFRFGVRNISSLLKIPPSEAQLIIDFADLDGDGCLSDYEFICLVSLFTLGSIEDRLIALFGLFDSDYSQLISKDELKRLLRCIMSINDEGKEPKAKDVDTKLSQMFGKLFIDEQEIRMSEFIVFAKENSDFKSALMKIGVIGENELIEDFDNDLELEICRENNIDDVSKRNIPNKSDQEEDNDGLFVNEQVKGDQFMAVKPFLGVIKNSIPSGVNPSKLSTSIPDAALILDYVHGYRCFDTRNNVKWVGDNENVFFHSAAIGVVMDIHSNTQKFNLGNTDDIISMDKLGNMIACGQIGHKPFINIWNLETMETICRINGKLEKGIASICFGKNGKIIAGVAMNDDHDIAFYNLSDPKNPKLHAYSKGVKDVILDSKFLNNESETVILATQKGLYLATPTNGQVFVKKVSGFGSSGAPTCLSIGLINGVDYVVGLQSGELAVGLGNSITKLLPAHKGPIFAICNSKDKSLLITGGGDGCIILWEKNFVQKKTIDLLSLKLNLIQPKVRAIDYNESTKKLIIGTRSGDILHLDTGSLPSPKIVLKSHYNDELWGLSMHPSQNEFVTVGEDFLLAKWDIKTRKQITALRLKYEAKTIDICSTAKTMAIGCKNGFLLILEYSSFNLISSEKISTKEISIVRFSPDSSQLAIGSHDSKIYLLNSKNKFSVKNAKICKGHHSAITHLDFTLDGKSIMSNCSSYEILFFATDSGKQLTSGASMFRDEKWATWTCVLGWPVQGVFPPCADGTDVNAVDRNIKGDLLVSGDDFGKVNLFRYPVMPKAACQQFIGHSSHVTNIKFTRNGDYVISTGGNDKSIIQWKVESGDNEEPDFDSDEVDESELIAKNSNEAQLDQLPEKEDQLFEELADETGDQFMAVKPYVGDLKKSIPSDYVYQKGMENEPEGTLSVHYVHGYRCFDARNTACFSDNSNKVVFASAALGVVLDIPSNTQSFFNLHEEDIISFSVHPNRKIVATGQMAQKGKSKLIDIFVWRIEDKAKLAHIVGFHIRGIQLLKFSIDGKYLLTFGQDDDNSLAVYDWELGILMCSSKVDKTNVLDCVFMSDNQFLTSGSKHLKCWTISGSLVSGRTVSWSSLNNKSESVVSLEALSSTICVGGTWSGCLIVISGGSISSKNEAHKGPVFVVHYSKTNKKLLSGGKDGVIKEWIIDGSKLKCVKTLMSFEDSVSQVSAIRLIDVFENRMLVGTRSSELWVVDDWSGKQNKNKILSGHFEGELWGMSCHPSKPLFVTSGDDNRIKLWHALENRQLAESVLTEKSRCVTFSYCGNYIVTVINGGKVIVFNGDLSRKITEYSSTFNKVNQWVEDIKFSPSGKYIAIGAHGGASKIEIINWNNDKMTQHALINGGLTSALLHLDWSESSSQLMINSQAYELKFVDIDSKKQIAASSVKDVKWSSWTCKLGWAVQGIFPGVDGTDVNTVCRSENEKILATGDDNQLVKIFKYPSVLPKTAFKSYIAHSSHVTRVRFMLNDSLLISIGGNDKAVIVWTTSFGSDPVINKLIKQKENIGSHTDLIDKDENNDLMEVAVKPKLEKNKYGKNDHSSKINASEPEDKALFEEEETQGTEFMAIKPWLGAIKQPSSFKQPKYLDDVPKVNIELEYAFGYRSKDCRNNVFIIDDKVYYHTAAVAVELNLESNTQRFFNCHSDDIISMAYNDNKNIFATGEIGPKPMLYIWGPNEMKEISLLKGGAIKGLCGLAFSPSGKRLAGICIDDNHHVVVFDTESSSLVSCEKGDTAVILDLAWINENEFCTVGMRHFKTWKNDVPLKGIKGSFGSFSDKLVSCKAWNGGIVAGTFEGGLEVWKGGSCTKTVKLHSGSLDSICILDSGCLLTGGKDSKIHFLKNDLSVSWTIVLDEILLDGLLNRVRAISLSKDQKQMIVGTFASEIYSLTLKNGKFTDKVSQIDIISELIMTGHFARNAQWTNEVWGLFSLNEEIYVTCSDDGTLRMWSATKRRLLKQLELNIDLKGAKLPLDKTTNDLIESAKLRAVTVCQEKKHLAVGCKEGTLRIVDIESWRQIILKKNRKEWISELRYSPDNKTLAVGSHDNTIELMDVLSNYKTKAKLSKHSSFITHLDWSQDSSYLHSNCGAYELLFWDANSGKQITSGASALKDEDWATWSCVLGWPVQGIFQSEWDGSDINMVDRSNTKINGDCRVIACSDDFSTIRIYNYPCLRKSAKPIILKGHSSHVTNVKFSSDDGYLYSTGGEDQTVFQWKILKNN